MKTGIRDDRVLIWAEWERRIRAMKFCSWAPRALRGRGASRGRFAAVKPSRCASRTGSPAPVRVVIRRDTSTATSPIALRAVRR